MLDRFSFWKPDPLPPRTVIAPVDLLSIGRIPEITEHMLDIPKMLLIHIFPWQETASSANFLWNVDEGVILKINAESGPPTPGEVIMIATETCVSERTFQRLYAHIYEHFGMILLDQSIPDFLTPEEFRSRDYWSLQPNPRR